MFVEHKIYKQMALCSCLLFVCVYCVAYATLDQNKKKNKTG